MRSLVGELLFIFVYVVVSYTQEMVTYYNNHMNYAKNLVGLEWTRNLNPHFGHFNQSHMVNTI